MLLTAQSAGHARTTTKGLELAVFEVDPTKGSEISLPLEAQGYRVRRYNSTTEAIASLRDPARPALLILATDPAPAGTNTSSAHELFALARELSLPTLVILEPGGDLKALLDQNLEFFDWVARASVPSELSARVAGLLHRQARKAESGPTASTMPTDPRFFPLIVHDLRTPLNVVGLSLRMIDQALPRGNPDLEEDLRFVEESFKQIERMLSQLSDYYRLFEPEAPVESMEFSPARLLSEVVETRVLKAGAKAVPIHLEVHQSCPPEALLDQSRAKQAIQYALGNALAASKVEGVHVTLHGGPDRWVTEFSVKHPPPPTVTSVELRSDLFERLCGTAAERRGMDLAIAARISEMFGGAARLEVDETRGSTIILDWPARSETK
ncbi:Signal transduction histidine kinase [Singulisphaera sp. GP187]|uniref:sensor histidine kinase n=1 Tax=Singulisphaera sp. GP187 TaxID=1882752 RepID=UPI000929F130|nr:HAMP domain-containing sensor histidine kinase [Singulisphaera sp. GP187]SIO66747.1 Signal transduction histidine kinase [Singulisphaera sp. GP187]